MMKSNHRNRLAIYYFPGKRTEEVCDYMKNALSKMSVDVDLISIGERESKAAVRARIGMIVFPILGDVRIPINVESWINSTVNLPKKMAVCVMGDYDSPPMECEVANEAMRLLASKGLLISKPLLLDSPFIDYSMVDKWLKDGFERVQVPNLSALIMPEHSDPILMRIIDVLPSTPTYKVDQEGKCTMLSFTTCCEYPRSLFPLQQLEELECLINKLTHLKDLRFPFLELHEWPFQHDSFQQIEVLDLRGCNFSSYSFLKDMKQLRKINLGANNLSEIPYEVFSLKQLEVMFIYKNYISKIPSEVKQLSNLRWLSMYRNRMETVPMELAGLKKLEKLNIGANPIVSLPSLPQLKTLVLRNCNLRAVPFHKEAFPALKEIDVSKNLLET